jgi:hypothetical protein
MASSLLSFLSIRSQTSRSEKYERLADNIFLVGLIVMFILTMVIAFNILD